MSMRAGRWKNSSTIARTIGMRVEPPTSTTESTSLGRRPAARSASFTTSNVRAISGVTSASSSARVTWNV